MSRFHCTGAKNIVRYNEVSLYRGSTVLGRRISFVITRASLNRGSLYRGSTVMGRRISFVITRTVRYIEVPL